MRVGRKSVSQAALPLLLGWSLALQLLRVHPLVLAMQRPPLQQRLKQALGEAAKVGRSSSDEDDCYHGSASSSKRFSAPWVSSSSQPPPRPDVRVPVTHAAADTGFKGFGFGGVTPSLLPKPQTSLKVWEGGGGGGGGSHPLPKLETSLGFGFASPFPPSQLEKNGKMKKLKVFFSKILKKKPTKTKTVKISKK